MIVLNHVISNPKDWWPNLDSAIANNAIRAFGTKKAASAAAMEFGWGRQAVVMVKRRCEHIYIVGTIDFQPEEVAGVVRTILRVPLLRYERDKNGTKVQPVVKFIITRKD